MSKAELKEKIKNIIKKNIQLVAVIGFVIGALMISDSLKSNHDIAKNDRTSDRVIFVENKIISPEKHRVSFETTGNVEARGEIEIVAQVGGRIVDVHESFFSGGNFKKDEVLFQIDPRDFEFEVSNLEAQVAKAQTVLELEIAESKAALFEWKQINNDKKAPKLVAREPQLAEAKSNLKSAKASLGNAKLNLERTKFTLPFDGKVLDSSVALGGYISAGQSYGTVFDINSLEVRASLEDNKLRWLLGTNNPEITISTTYLGQTKEYQGKLKRSASSLNTATRFATVRFGFLEEIDDLLPGVFADIKIRGQQIDNVLLIDPSALQDQSTIWAIENDKLVKIEPEIIYSNSNYFVIKAENKEINVVISRLSGVSEGMKVVSKNVPVLKKQIEEIIKIKDDKDVNIIPETDIEVQTTVDSKE
ncbi:MAG: RND family efflux transporter MFP subunit [Rickettsiales bacterium]|jgi:RND family efflux transporter MFP subunit